MGSFLTAILADLFSGASFRRIAAVEALDKPAINPTAQRYRTAAVGFLFAGASLLLAAAIFHSFTGNGTVDAVMGFGGLACLQACFMCGLRYGRLNQPSDESV